MLVRKLIFLGALIFVGCATPPEVKQLSVKQNAYFDAAIVAASLQSEALILATEKVIELTLEKIIEQERQQKDLYIQGLQAQITNNEAIDAVAGISNLSIKVKESRIKFQNDINAIKIKSNELIEFLVQMKEVNTTLDAYIQSEKAGEAIVKEISNQPSVSALLNKVSSLTPQITNTVDALTNIISGIRTN
jgi:hypothetical protein